MFPSVRKADASHDSIVEPTMTRGITFFYSMVCDFEKIESPP
jgi:hypothetical protein